MATIKFTKEHEWVSIDGDIGTIGISDYAQTQLGDVVFVELPEVGRTVEKGDEIAVVESVKAASEVYSPASGEVTEANETLSEDPAKINADAVGAGWIFKIKLSDAGELDGLMDETAYATYLEDIG
jgi:glycine cleavage system H protein